MRRGEAPTEIGSPLQRTLLAMLIVNRVKTVSTDRIVDALWRDEPKAGRKKLWFHMSKLRSALADTDGEIVSVSGGYQLQTREASVDSLRFEQLAVDGRSVLETDPGLAADRLGSALTLWRGQAYSDVSPDAIGWAEPVRLNELRVSVEEDRVEAELALDRYERAIGRLRSLVHEHPYRERLRAQLMRALYAVGRQAEALAVYRDAANVLVNALGIDPSPALQELELRILRQADDLARAQMPYLSVSAVEHGEDTAEGSRADTFVGREEPLKLISASFDRAIAGSTEVVLVRGESGSGKTMLAREFARRAAAAESDLLVIGAQTRVGSGSNDPFGVIRDLIRLLIGDIDATKATNLMSRDTSDRLVRASPAIFDALVRRGSGVVDRLITAQEVRTRAESVGIDPGGTLEVLDRGWVPERIGNDVIDLVAEVAIRRPVLMIVDDLQWADPTSIDVLRGVVEHGRGRVLLLGTFRTEAVEGATDHPLRTTVNELRRLRGRIVVDLDQVAADEASSFVGRLLDRERNTLDDSFRADLTRVSEGHALFAVELIAEFKNRGILRRSDEGWYVESEPEWDLWPYRVEGVVAARFEGMSQEVSEALVVASVEGEEFTAEVVASVLGLDESEAIHLLSNEGSVRHHVLVATGASRLGQRRVLRYRFRHQLFQRFLYERLDEVERAHLHGEIATTLDAMAGSGVDDEYASTLAHHYERAGMNDEALTHLSGAVRRSIRFSANQTAAELATRALSMVNLMPSGLDRDEKEFDFQLQLGTARAIIAGFAAEEVGKAFLRASALASVVGTPGARMQVYFGLRMHQTSWGDFDRADETKKAMYDLADSTADEALLLQALHSEWPDALFRGDVERCIELSRTGRKLYRREVHHPLTFRFGNHDAAVCSLTIGGLALAIRGEARRAVTAMQQAIDLGRTLDHKVSVLQPASLLAWVHQINGDLPLAASAAEKALAMGMEAPMWTGAARAVHAWAVHSGSHSDAAIDTLSREFEYAFEANHGWLRFIGSMLIEVLVGSGRLRDAERVGQRMRDDADLGDGFYLAEALRTEGLLRVARDDPRRGRELLAEAAEHASEQAAYSFALRASVMLARTGGGLDALSEVASSLPPEIDNRLVSVAKDLLAGG